MGIDEPVVATQTLSQHPTVSAVSPPLREGCRVSPYIASLLISCCIYSVLAMTLDILVGETGIFSAAHAVFFALGAYAAGLTLIHLTSSVLVGIAIAVALSALAGLLLALTAIRSAEITFVVSSLAIGIVFTQVVASWNDFTGGEAGLAGIVSPTIFGFTLASQDSFVTFALVVTGVVMGLRYLVSRSGMGLRMRIVREDSLAATSFGARISLIKITAVVVSSGLASLGGVLYAYYITFISPGSFTINVSLLIAVMVIIGGAGRVLGPVIGATIITLLPNYLQNLPIPASHLGAITQVIYGTALVVIMMVEPGGLQTLAARFARRIGIPLAGRDKPGGGAPGVLATEGAVSNRPASLDGSLDG